VDRRTLTVVSLYGVGAAGALILAALDGQARALGPAGMPVVIVLAVVWALVFAGMAWNRTDEAAREAHKFAAFWGAPFAMLALLVGLPIVAVTVFHTRLYPDLAHAADGKSSWALVIAGVMLAGLAQGLGYLVAWAGWWLKRR